MIGLFGLLTARMMYVFVSTVAWKSGDLAKMSKFDKEPYSRSNVGARMRDIIVIDLVETASAIIDARYARFVWYDELGLPEPSRPRRDKLETKLCNLYIKIAIKLDSKLAAEIMVEKGWWG